MTALLTDESIIVACRNHAQAATRLMGDTEERQEHLEYAERDFEAGARFARSIYEARLAEREKLWRKLFGVGGLPISARSIGEYEKLCEALGLERG